MRLFQFDNPEISSQSTQATARPLQADGDGESVMEDWLTAAPAALLEEPILVFSRQPNLPTGEADLLGLDRFGNIVVFELKRGDSGSESASESSIISQPQLYAQALSDYDYHELEGLSDEFVTGYSAPEPLQSQETLIQAFNAFFGTSFSEWELNQAQRVVIVAEEITAQTRKSAR